MIANITIRPYCLGFTAVPPETRVTSETRVTWTATPHLPFRTRGLMVWGAANDSMLLQFTLGNVQYINGGMDPIPLRFFDAGMSFRDFELLIDADIDAEPRWYFEGTLKDNPKVHRRQLFDLPTVTIPECITVRTSGPIDTLVLWGLAAEGM